MAGRRTAGLWFFLLVFWAATAQGAPIIGVSYDAKVSKGPFTGRLYLTFHHFQIDKPPDGPNWFNPEPFFAVDVKGLLPGQTVTFDDKALSYPVPLSKVANGVYWAQAVLDFNQAMSFSAAEGNGYSLAARVEIGSTPAANLKLHIDQVFHVRRPQDTARVKLVEIKSPLLSAFHGRAVYHRAAVMLPASFGAEQGKRYPVVYVVPGFGGTYTTAFSLTGRNPTDVAGVEMLYVVLDPSCPLGHHVFADSDNNGPHGQALVEELIPYVERSFRGLGTPDARFVTGHSSGGWSSLWLQITYPDFFGGVWSTSPDPVDFRDFQRINIYRAGENMFVDAAGQRRPVARRGNQPFLWFQPFSDMEAVMGHGGQLGSFEAVFSRRGPDGKPVQLWDRATGKIDFTVAKSWERYDIRLVMERNWTRLGPKLTGKIHVYMGALDTFYLDGAVVLLKQSLARLGSDADVELFPGRDHSTLLDSAMRSRIAQEMARQFRKIHP